MSKVTYFEYRPGHWVKLVNGRAVGPATAEEVAEWQREKAEQARIWRDVVKEVTPSTPQPDQPPEAARRKGEGAQADQAGIWQDVVSQVAPSKPEPAQPSAAPTPAPEFELTERRAKPRPVTVAEAIQAAERGEPVIVRGSEMALAEEAAKAATQATKPESAPRAKPATAKVPRKPTPKAVKAVPKKAAAATAVQEPAPRRAKAVLPKKAAKLEPVVTVEAPPIEKPARPTPKRATTALRAEPAKPKPRPTPEAIPSKEVATPAARPAKAAPQKEARPEPVLTAKAMPAVAEIQVEPEAAVKVAPPRKTLEAKHRPPAARRKQKVPPASAKDESSPLYLWIMASPTEDLAGAVRSGLSRYEERFNEPAGAVLCHADDLPALEEAGLAVDIRQGKGVPPHNFWIGPK